jgi:hypothetical protein
MEKYKLTVKFETLFFRQSASDKLKNKKHESVAAHDFVVRFERVAGDERRAHTRVDLLKGQVRVDRFLITMIWAPDSILCFLSFKFWRS